MGILESFKNKLSNSIGPGSYTYGIFKACRRCSYAKSHEPILIYSFDRGTRIVVNYNGKTYVRNGKCIGFAECKLKRKCLDKIDNPELDVSCKWKEL